MWYNRLVSYLRLTNLIIENLILKDERKYLVMSKIIRPLNSKLVEVLHKYGFEVYVEDGIENDAIEYRDEDSCIAVEVSKVEVEEGTPFAVMSPMKQWYVCTYVVYREDSYGYYQPILETHSEDEVCDFLDEIDDKETWWDYYEEDSQEVESQNIEKETVKYEVTPKLIINKYGLKKNDTKEYIRGNFIFDYSDTDNYVVWQADENGDFYCALESSELRVIDKFISKIDKHNNWDNIFEGEKDDE